MRPLPHSEVYRLFNLRGGRDITHRGTALADAPSGGVDLVAWDATFVQDFEDAATAVTYNSDPSAHITGRFYTPGRYGGGAYTYPMQSTNFVPEAPALGGENMYRQAGASSIYLSVGRFLMTDGSGNGNRATNMESMRRDPAQLMKQGAFEDITEGFSQQYGYHECRFKCPPTYDEHSAVKWPAYWMYSEVWNNPFQPAIELDVVELYISCKNGTTAEAGQPRGDGTHHLAWHYHNAFRSFNSGGFINKDYNISGQTMGMNPNATFGTASDFEWGDDFHQFGLLFTPRWLICYLDRLEVGRFVMVDEFHQRFYHLVSHQIQGLNGPTTKPGAGSPIYQGDPARTSSATTTDPTKALLDGNGDPLPTSPATWSGGFVADTFCDMEVDYVKSWQNPDLDNLTITNVGAAYAVTSGLPWASYVGADERSISGTVSDANATTTPTLNVNALGAKTIKKHDDFAESPPWTGDLIALEAGDITEDGRHCFEWNEAGDCWILLNPGRSWRNFQKYEAPTFDVAAQEVSREDIEAAICAKYDYRANMPSEHPVNNLGFVPASGIYPRPKAQETIVTVVTRPAGYVIGKVSLTNAPTTPGRWTIEENDYVSINPATGSLTIKEDAELTVQSLELTAHCWSPGVRTPLNANACRVVIDFREDIDMTMSYFGANLMVDIDITDPDVLFQDSGRTIPVADGDPVGGIADKSGQAEHVTQTTDASRPTYDADGFNGSCPALVSTGSPIHMNFAPLISGFPVNAFNGVNLTADGTAAGVSFSVISNIYDTTGPVIIYWDWSISGEVNCYINGVNVGTLPYSGTPTSFGWCAIVVERSDTGTTASVFSQNETNSRLLTAAGLANYFKGAFSYLAVGKSAPTSANRERIEGYLAHKCWDDFEQENPLPTDHPYKTTRPKQYS